MLDARFDDLYAIIPHPMEPHILLLGGEHGYALPRATVPLCRPIIAGVTPHVNRAFGRLLGLDVTTYACRDGLAHAHAVSCLPWDIKGEQEQFAFCLRKMLELA